MHYRLNLVGLSGRGVHTATPNQGAGSTLSGWGVVCGGRGEEEIEVVCGEIFLSTWGMVMEILP